MAGERRANLFTSRKHMAVRIIQNVPSLSVKSYKASGVVQHFLRFCITLF